MFQPSDRISQGASKVMSMGKALPKRIDFKGQVMAEMSSEASKAIERLEGKQRSHSSDVQQSNPEMSDNDES
jgi:hypothetical protein